MMTNFYGKYINPLTDFGFKKLFSAAEIAKFSPKERAAYEDSLKYYRDIKNVVDTSKQEGIDEEKDKRIIKQLVRGKLTIDEIAEDFEVSKDYVKSLQEKKLTNH